MWGGGEFQDEIAQGKEFWNKFVRDWGTTNVLADWEHVKYVVV